MRGITLVFPRLGDYKPTQRSLALLHLKGQSVATTEEILTAAGKLGALLNTHTSMKNYRELVRQLELDVGARNLLQEFEQLVETVSYKEATMQPVEIAEKQKLQSLQQSVAIHPLLKKLMAAQVDYADLMRKVQEAINAGSGDVDNDEIDESPAPAASKLIL